MRQAVQLLGYDLQVNAVNNIADARFLYGTIDVYDLMGRKVWSSTQSARSDMYTSTPVTWDLTDVGGRRVPRGIYVYRATITTDGVKEATKAKKLAVTSE
jgi:hypothetical protein